MSGSEGGWLIMDLGRWVTSLCNSPWLSWADALPADRLQDIYKETSYAIHVRENCSNFWYSTSQQINMGCIIKVWVLKLFVAGKQADLMLSPGNYHEKFNTKNLGNKSSFPQEKGAAKYPGLQVEFPALWNVPAASTGLCRRSGWSGVLTVKGRVQARNQQVWL